MKHNTDKQKATVRQKAPEKSWSQIRCEELQEQYESACNGRTEARNHAAKLAEALRDIRATIEANDMAHVSYAWICEKATDALAAYESEAAQ